MIKIVFYEFDDDIIPRSVTVDCINVEQAKNDVISIYPDAIIISYEFI